MEFVRACWLAERLVSVGWRTKRSIFRNEIIPLVEEGLLIQTRRGEFSLERRFENIGIRVEFHASEYDSGSVILPLLMRRESQWQYPSAYIEEPDAARCVELILSGTPPLENELKMSMLDR